MWYWFCVIASVTLVIGAVALILWWAWRQETASQFADTLDRRFAKYKTEPKPQLHRHPEPLKAYLDWVDWRGDLDERVKNLDYHLLALEETVRGWDCPPGFLARLTQVEGRLKWVAETDLKGRARLLDWVELHQRNHEEAATPSPATDSTRGPNPNVDTLTTLKGVNPITEDILPLTT